MTASASRKRDRPTVVVIEDDKAVRESLDGLFRSLGLGVELFASVEKFLSAAPHDAPGCMVLDIRLPGKSGLDFFEDLVKSGSHPSVVFISGHADVPMSVRAMKAGAVEFLTKPVREQDLINAVNLAIERDRVRREQLLELENTRSRFDALSVLERELIALMGKGTRDKQIAAALALSETKVRFHRDEVILKMQAASLVELLRMVDSLKRLD